jgi:hypothetical protein
MDHLIVNLEMIIALASMTYNVDLDPGEVTPCQIKNHVQRKFATPISNAIDIFLNYDIFLYIHNH